jgi:hypothetical protein
MRRVVRAALLVAAVVSVVAGCSRPTPGIDGNLVNGWSQMPEATVPVPADHACYALADLATVRPPVECTTTHVAETFHVGTFTGEDAARGTPPLIGGAGRRKAYEECASSAKTFLGDDWRTGRPDMALTLPKDAYWEGGARWFRCDLMASNVHTDKSQEITQSLQGALAGNRPFGIGCVNIAVTNAAVDSITDIACSAPHNGEFAGVFEGPDVPYPTDDAKRSEQTKAGCLTVIAGFTGVPNDSNIIYRTGLVRSPFGAEEWGLGNRGARCYLWHSGKTFTSSLKGAGPDTLPINYA